MHILRSKNHHCIQKENIRDGITKSKMLTIPSVTELKELVNVIRGDKGNI